MPVDPQMQVVLDARAALPPIHTLSVADARAQFKLPRPPGLRIAEVASVADRAIPGPGGPLRLRVYTPPGSGPFPLLVFFHGGGFVVCDLDTHDPTCRNLCAGAGCVVASVDYRLAPEHRFPAAPDDCLAATRWAAGHAAELGADPARGVAVAGDSAGGNLAAVTAIRARDDGGPRLAGQLLVYPGTDWEMAPRPSLVECGEGYWLTARDMAWFRDHYLSGPAEHRHPHASPIHAADLRGLPPALVVTAEYDPLRDEGEAYAARLRDAGVPTTISRYEGVIHGFFSLRGLVGRSDAAQEEASAWLRGVFAGRA
jgi:acetyl esterase/lipase